MSWEESKDKAICSFAFPIEYRACPVSASASPQNRVDRCPRKDRTSEKQNSATEFRRRPLHQQIQRWPAAYFCETSRRPFPCAQRPEYKSWQAKGSGASNYKGQASASFWSNLRMRQKLQQNKVLRFGLSGDLRVVDSPLLEPI